MTLADLIAAADREANHRKTVYKRLRMHDFVTDDYADGRIREMLLISEALKTLAPEVVKTLPINGDRPAEDGKGADRKDAGRRTPRKGHEGNRKRRIRGAA